MDPKTTFAIDAVDFSESLDKRLFFAIAQYSCGDELEVARDGQEERNFVYNMRSMQRVMFLY